MRNVSIARLRFFVMQVLFFAGLLASSAVLALQAPAGATRKTQISAAATQRPASTIALADSVNLPQTNGNLKFGLFTDTPNVHATEAELGSKLDIVAWFTHWDQSLGNNKLSQACTAGYVPEITWESWNGQAQGTQDTYPLGDIVSGKYDSFIRSNLQQVKNLCGSRTVLLRFDHEMATIPGLQGWYPWQGNPEAYIAAWQHVVQLGRGIDPNIKWVWSPNRGTAFDAQYYPGNGWVDYVGITLNHRPGQESYQTFAAFYNDNRQVIESFAKPVIIAETTSAEGFGQKAGWVKNMFEYASHDPNIVAIVWFNGSPSASDERFDSSPASLIAFREALNTLHAQEKK